VFAKDKTAQKFRKKLERLLHPAIWKEVARKRGLSKKRLMVVEVPLLFESGFDKKMDYSIVAFCSKKVQLKRCDPSFTDRISFQMPLSKKIKKADFVINTSFGKRESRKQVQKIMKALTF